MVSLVNSLPPSKKTGIYDDTLIIIASKHGQAPIDPTLFREIAPALLVNLTGVPIAQATTDDVALIFLEDQKSTAAAVANLSANRAKLSIEEIISGPELAAQGFGDPLKDPAVPDIIVRPTKGVIYTTSKAKIAEHGGLSDDDRKVALIVSNPGLKGKKVGEFVQTKQVAVSVLDALGIKKDLLEGARKEETMALPGL